MLIVLLVITCGCCVVWVLVVDGGPMRLFRLCCLLLRAGFSSCCFCLLNCVYGSFVDLHYSWPHCVVWICFVV